MNEEYKYNIGKYTIGVDKGGYDGIGLTVAIINDNGEIHLLENYYGENARCIDLLIKENQQLKEQLKQNFNTDFTSMYIYCEEQVKDKIKELDRENQQLKENWNKLKLFLANGLASSNYIINEHCMLNKMYELEKSDK